MLFFDWSGSLDGVYSITIEYTFGTSIRFQILFAFMSPGTVRDYWETWNFLRVVSTRQNGPSLNCGTINFNSLFLLCACFLLNLVSYSFQFYFLFLFHQINFVIIKMAA